MNHLTRFAQRMVVFFIGLITVWLVSYFYFDSIHEHVYWLFALLLTYIFGAYFIVPISVHMGLKVLRRKHVPGYTTTSDGFPADPVNISLIGTKDQLLNAFKSIGWYEADKLSIVSSFNMIRSFILKKPYNNAPFSNLFIFGRKQDFGFQYPIGNSPRKRHHVRFWPISIEDRTESDLLNLNFWTNNDKPDTSKTVIWVGAATKDTGIGLEKFTLQFTHSTDKNTNSERNFIMDRLSSENLITNASQYNIGEPLKLKNNVNKYIFDGNVSVAVLR